MIEKTKKIGSSIRRNPLLSTFFTLLMMLVLVPLSTMANIMGSPVENFNPSYSARDFVTVQSSNTIKKNRFNAGYFIDYAKGTLPSIGVTSDRGDNGIYSHFLIGYGITDRWDIGGSFPYILNQSLDEAQHLAQFGSTGLLEARLSTKYKILNFESGGGVAVLGHLGFNRTKNLPYVGDGAGPSYVLEVAADKVWGAWRASANLGYKIFNPGPQFAGFTAFEPIENAVLASGGVSYQFRPHWLGIAELWAAFPDVEFNNVDRKESSIEALLGAMYKHDLEQDEGLNLLLGLTRGINKGISTPDLRAFLGITYVFGFKDRAATPSPVIETEEEVAIAEEVPEVVEEEKESFYDPGYRQGYLAHEGLGDYPFSGKDFGSTIGQGYKYDEGFHDAYLDAPSEIHPAPLASTPYARGYHLGFQTKMQKGPEAEHHANIDHVDSLSEDQKYIEGYKQGWTDAPGLPGEDENVMTVSDENLQEFVELKPAVKERISFENILFHFNSYKLRKESLHVLDKLYDHLNKESFESLEIWGHTDNVGQKMYNEKLSLYRAGAVYYYLLRRGIPKEKMMYDGWGMRKPVVPNDTPENRFKNRRVEFIILRSAQE